MCLENHSYLLFSWWFFFLFWERRGEKEAEGADPKPTAVLYGDAGTEEEGLAFLDKVFESGCRFWDTAEVRPEEMVWLGWCGGEVEMLTWWYGVIFRGMEIMNC